MGHSRNWSVMLSCLGIAATCSAVGCGLGDDDPSAEKTISALMDDGDPTAIAPASMVPPPPVTLPPRFCPSGDCSRDPLAFWKVDDCNPSNTQLSDSAVSTIPHPAFRAVSVDCVPSIDNVGLRIDGDDDIMYSPDQPDYVFDGGLTIAAWINPDRITGTQVIARKRLDASSSFVLAIDGRRLVFAARLTNGRLAVVSAPASTLAKRFTHVAATYDGQQAVLYIDGTPAASTRAAGTIARGAGPIFVGNDANGREMTGIVDDVWLNTLAAPADVIRSTGDPHDGTCLLDDGQQVCAL